MTQMPSPADLAPSLSAQLSTAILSRPVSDDDLAAAALFMLDAVANIVSGRNSVQGRKLLAWQSAMSAGSGHPIDRGRLAFFPFRGPSLAKRSDEREYCRTAETLLGGSEGSGESPRSKLL